MGELKSKRSNHFRTRREPHAIRTLTAAPDIRPRLDLIGFKGLTVYQNHFSYLWTTLRSFPASHYLIARHSHMLRLRRGEALDPTNKCVVTYSECVALSSCFLLFAHPCRFCHLRGRGLNGSFRWWVSVLLQYGNCIAWPER